MALNTPENLALIKSNANKSRFIASFQSEKDKMAGNQPDPYDAYSEKRAINSGLNTNKNSAPAIASSDADSYARGLNNMKDPLADAGKIGSMFYGDPRIQRVYGGMFQADQQFGKGVADFGQYSKGFMGDEASQLQNMAQGGGPSYVNDAAQVQRQNAQGAIAQQAMMGSRGGLSPAAQRQAIMGASNVQANMAGQVAAARSQERMQALNQLMQARQAQLGARTTSLGAQQNLTASRQGQTGLVGQQKGGVLGMATDVYGKRMEGITGAKAENVDPRQFA